MEIGLIGLGRMGTGIAKSLLRSGHRLTVFNRTRARAESLQSDGANIAGSVAEACRSSVVFTMVADDAALEALVFGESGVLSSLRKDSIHVSLSTISVALSDRLSAEHAKAGQQFVAAPVFGRPEAVVAVVLWIAHTFALEFADATPYLAITSPEKGSGKTRLLESMGPKLLVVGERPSIANVVKLCGNFLIATVLESLAESLTFARKSGVDPQMLLDFLTTTMFTAPVYKSYGELIVQGKHEPAGFALPLGLKDVRLVLQAAESAGVPMPIASVLRDRFITALARGNQDKDWSVIGRVAAEDAGLPSVRN